MTNEEAHTILSWRGLDGELKPLVERLRAHAQLWRTGFAPEHAFYIDEAADEIERLRSAEALMREHCAAVADQVYDKALKSPHLHQCRDAVGDVPAQSPQRSARYS